MTDTSQKNFSIITPSRNMLSYLKRCCRSVRDQSCGEVEHIVVDGGSTDGTREWLEHQTDIVKICEADSGMYDAINKGLRNSQGSLIAYLNCDEQYLPGALKFVRNYFYRNPSVDILFGDVLVLRPDGTLQAFRKAYPPRWFYMMTSHLYTLSCAMFFRARLIHDGFMFRESLKYAGDLDFVVRVLRHRYKAVYARKYLSAFTMTGDNIGGSLEALAEMQELQAGAPKWVKCLSWPLTIGRFAEKALSGAYLQRFPIEYEVYISEEDVTRRSFRAAQASFRWRRL